MMMVFIWISCMDITTLFALAIPSTESTYITCLGFTMIRVFFTVRLPIFICIHFCFTNATVTMVIVRTTIFITTDIASSGALMIATAR